MQAWSNHKFITVPDRATISQLSPGFSLFETFALRGGKVELAEFHESRLMSAFRHLHLDQGKLHLNFSDKIHHWEPILKNLLVKEELSDAIIRWMIVPDKDGTLTEWVTVRALPTTPTALDLFILNTARDNAEWLPRPKTGPWLNSQSALDELKQISPRPDVEGLQLDQHGNLSECTRSSLIWCEGSQWFTPNAQTQCLQGTTLQALQKSLGDKKEVKAVACAFPQAAKSFIVLRSTFDSGAVIVNKVFNSQGQPIWAAESNQAQAETLLFNLKQFRAQRSVSLL